MDSRQRRSLDPSGRLNSTHTSIYLNGRIRDTDRTKGKQMASEQSQNVRPSSRLHTLNDGVHIPPEYRHIPGQVKDSDGAQRSSSAAASPFVNPTSTLLQNLINEQRASRGPRASSACEQHHVESSLQASNNAGTTDQQEDSSSEKQRKINHALSAGLKQPREMGFREMDQYVSKLNKLNFDLKLEVFHRAQQVSALEKKLEKMDELEEQVQHMELMDQELQELRATEEDNQRLRESNEELRSELDKRDQAVNEAVELICQLEAKLEALEAQREEERPQTARPYSGDSTAAVFTSSSPRALTPKNKIILDVPERTSSRRDKRPSMSRSYSNQMEAHIQTPTPPPGATRRPQRQPSFLKGEDNNTSALRNVYMTDADKSRTTFNAFSVRGTDDGTHEMESPRLSALSECSYLDPPQSPSDAYGPGRSKLKVNTDLSCAKIPIDEPLSPLERSHSTSKHPPGITRIEQWMQPDRMESMRSSKSKETRQPDAILRTPTNNQFALPGAKQSSKGYNFDPPSLVIPQYNVARLPPTPDTMSTTYAEMRNKSNSSIIAERSRYDRSNTIGRTLSIDRTLGRRRSANDVATTRPSTAETVLSDGLETWSDSTQPAFITDEEYQMASMFPSFAYTHRPSTRTFDPAAHAGAVNELGVIIPKNRGRHSHEKTSQEQIRKVSNAPSLTPEDWLEAALPASSSNEDKDIKSSQHKPSEPMEHRTAYTQQTPPSGNGFRNRGARVLSELQPRRRINLRPPFFNKIPTYSPAPRSNSIAGLSLSTGHSPASVSKNLQNDHHPAPSPSNNVGGTTRRPKTSETNDHKRRSSHGFFGWMKGSGTVKDADPSLTPPATATSVLSAYAHPELDQQKSPSYTQMQRTPIRGSARPGSALAFTNEFSSSPTEMDPLSASMHADEPSDRRSRFSVRRPRR
ncbi:hypothetical protein MGYG_06791 [Nannizzia gypsea CBS 118893]|uniref:Centrosomin N-terminal motif 1 domain-containing protein n=1 Tax=Arthroderma gypseum (strain ATCC MYA-4604 / CBS 118893) TaxID=535722 RepID=E4V177_ARTGP|nr:hypothetical protein MGYG_06791 [Nannizzia gypsea CBS 118893]EFR03792.1 hypothetical protein MGYG_06791 [Nannizzia gypsea CBS 118893]